MPPYRPRASRVCHPACPVCSDAAATGINGLTVELPEQMRKNGYERGETERAELIAALHQAATFGERLLKLTERLLDALTTGENRPDSEELDYLRAGLSRWREQISTLRQRIHGLTVEPPQRMQ
jgi:hypothetical protein